MPAPDHPIQAACTDLEQVTVSHLKIDRTVDHQTERRARRAYRSSRNPEHQNLTSRLIHKAQRLLRAAMHAAEYVRLAGG
jgi:hypothetical protein